MVGVPTIYEVLMPRQRIHDSVARGQGSARVTPMLYADAEPLIRNGDIVLFRVNRRQWLKPSTWLITTISKSPYVHAGMSARVVSGRLTLLDTIQWIGGRRVDLEDQVRRHPGQWDVYRPHQPYNGEAAAKEMLQVVNRPYGWRNLFMSSLRHTIIISRFLPPFTDDQLNGSAPFCSQAVSKACRAGGRDPRPLHADIETEPGHLSRPDFADSICRLYWKKFPEVVR